MAVVSVLNLNWIAYMAATSLLTHGPQYVFFTCIVKVDLPHPVTIALF